MPDAPQPQENQDTQLARVRRNMSKMVSAGAQDAELQTYIKSEGLDPALLQKKQPTWAQRFATGLAAGQSAESERATADKFGVAPNSLNSVVHPDYDPIQGTARALRDIVPGLTGMGGAAIGAGIGAPTGPGMAGTAVAGGALGALGGSYALDALEGALGGVDARSAGQMLLDKTATAGGGALALPEGFAANKIGARAAARVAMGRPVSENAPEVLQEMTQVGKPNIESIFPASGTSATPIKAAYGEHMKQLASELPGLAPGVPGSTQDSATGGELIRGLTSAGANASPYFKAADAAYEAGMQGFKQKAGKVPLASFKQTLLDQQATFGQDPEFAKFALGDQGMKMLERGAAANWELSADAALQMRSRVGTMLRDSNLRGDAGHGQLQQWYSALTDDITSRAHAVGEGANVTAANAGYKEAMATARQVGGIANSASANKALQLSAADLSADAIGSIKKVMPAPAFDNWVRNITENHLFWRKAAAPGEAAGFNLGKGMTEIANMSPESKDLLWGPLVGPAPPPGSAAEAKLAFRKATESVNGVLQETNFFGDSSKPPPNPLISAAISTAKLPQPVAKYLLSGPKGMAWLANAGRIRPEDSTGMLQAIAQIGNQTAKDYFLRSYMNDPQKTKNAVLNSINKPVAP